MPIHYQKLFSQQYPQIPSFNAPLILPAFSVLIPRHDSTVGNNYTTKEFVPL